MLCNDDYFAFKKLLKEKIWMVHGVLDIRLGHYKAISKPSTTKEL